MNIGINVFLASTFIFLILVVGLDIKHIFFEVTVQSLTSIHVITGLEMIALVVATWLLTATRPGEAPRRITHLTRWGMLGALVMSTISRSVQILAYNSVYVPFLWGWIDGIWYFAALAFLGGIIGLLMHIRNIMARIPYPRGVWHLTLATIGFAISAIATLLAELIFTLASEGLGMLGGDFNNFFLALQVITYITYLAQLVFIIWTLVPMIGLQRKLRGILSGWTPTAASNQA